MIWLALITQVKKFTSLKKKKINFKTLASVNTSGGGGGGVVKEDVENYDAVTQEQFYIIQYFNAMGAFPTTKMVIALNG